MLGDRRSKSIFYMEDGESVSGANSCVEPESTQFFEHGQDWTAALHSDPDAPNGDEAVKEIQPENVADMEENEDKQKEKHELELTQEESGEYVPPKRPVSTMKSEAKRS